MRPSVAEDSLVYALLSQALINQFPRTCVDGHCLSVVLESIGSDWTVLSVEDASVIFNLLRAPLAAAGQSPGLESDLASEDVLHLSK